MYIYTYEKCKFDPPFFSFKPKRIFSGRSKVCDMTNFSGAEDKEGFDGITLLPEFEDYEYVYFSGLEITEFKTDDKYLDYTSLVGNNMVRYAIIVGENSTYFLNNRYKFVENDKIEEGTLLNATNANLDPYDYHLNKSGKDSLEKLEHTLIHTCWPSHIENGDDEDEISDIENAVAEDENEEDEDLIETKYLNGNNERVKIHNQKCVICLEKESIYAFTQCGHQCICQDCYENKGDIDILKCVVCRT